jgi:hypothetical protein
MGCPAQGDLLFGRTHDLREPVWPVPRCLRGGKISSGSERRGVSLGAILGVVIGNRGGYQRPAQERRRSHSR